MTDGEVRQLVASEFGRALGKRTDVAVRIVVGSPFPGVALNIGPGLRWFRAGRLKLVSVQELVAAIERNSAMTLGGER